MDHEMSLSNEDSTVDYKVTKRHFPRTNNESCLEFIFEKDPNPPQGSYSRKKIA